jgi:hypothetical protein
MRLLRASPHGPGPSFLLPVMPGPGGSGDARCQMPDPVHVACGVWTQRGGGGVPIGPLNKVWMYVYVTTCTQGFGWDVWFARFFPLR